MYLENPSKYKQENNFLIKTYVMGTQKNRLNETVLLSTKTYVKIMGMKIFTILR